MDGLLVLARADAHATPGGTVDLAELASERVAVWKARADDLEVGLIAEGNGGGRVHGSMDGLRQVLDNLIENALEASPARSTVTVVAAASELRVRDEGPGLSPEQREHAFDRFWRARTGAGSGLGLAIVRRLVDADRGTVELRPAAGRGLEAVVRLPAGD